MPFLFRHEGGHGAFVAQAATIGREAGLSRHTTRMFERSSVDLAGSVLSRAHVPGRAPAVLVVEQGLPDASALAEMISELDVRTIPSPSLAHAAETMRDDPAVVLLDPKAMTPSGVEALTSDPSLADVLPVLLLVTTHPPSAAQTDLQGVGLVDTLLRPVDPDLLRSRVATLSALQARVARRDALERSVENERHTAVEAERRAARERHRLLRKIAAADRQRDELLATLAHELRNPLAPVVTGLELIRGHTAAVPELEHVHATMQRQVHHLIRLVDDLLDASRISRGTIALRRDWIDLSEVVRHAIVPWTEEVRRRRHDLELELPETPVCCHADRVRLAQLVDNLLANAIRHTHTDAHIRIRVACKREEIALTVADDGPGIPRELMDRVFDMFVQANRGIGLGLGLPLVRQIARLHGGSVAIRDTEGGGATFEIRLPLRPRARPSVGRDRPRVAEDRPLRLVLIEDDPDVRETTRLLLEAWGHTVEVASTGLDGVDTVVQCRPEVVLVDLGLPDIDGHTTARRIRDLMGSRHPRLVALTGFGQDEDRCRSRAAGFEAHLLKPVSPETLRGALAAVVQDRERRTTDPSR
jgi:signal transduction histidine kinase/CheY-like chemotaxis protein